MKKITIFICIVLIFIFSVLIFNNKKRYNVSEENKHNINENSKETNQIKSLKNKYEKFDWNIDISPTEIKDINIEYYGEQYFITKDGDLYVFSNKLFSNEKYYKKIDSDKKFSKFLGRNVVTYDNVIMKIENTYSLVETDFENSSEHDYQNIYTPSNTLHQEYLKVENNEMYYFKYDFWNNKYNKEYKVENFPVNNEILLEQLGYVFKTDKNYYKYGIINVEETDKYVDAKPKYGLVLIKNASDIYDDILFYNGRFLVFKNDLNHIYCTDNIYNKG